MSEKYNYNKCDNSVKAFSKILLKASIAGREHIVAYLLNKGADTNIIQCDSGKSPLLWVLFHHKFKMVENLLNCGANVNHVCKYGKNGLFYAGRCENVINLLISRGINVNHKYKEGVSALMEIWIVVKFL